MSMVATCHYGAKDFDEGPVIYEVEMHLPPGKTRETVIATDISHVGNKTFFQSLYTALELMEMEFEGQRWDISFGSST